MKEPATTLVIITPAFPANESETHWVPFLQSMVRSLQRQGLDMVVLALNYPASPAVYHWHGIKVISLGGLNRKGFHRIILRRKGLNILEGLRKQRKIAGLFSIWYGESASIGKHFGKRHGIRHLTWICGQDARSFNKWPRRLGLNSHELLAVSPFLVKEFEMNHGVRPAHVIPVAIDPAAFPPLSPIKDIDIIAAGSLVKLKRYDRFVRVIAQVKQEFPLLVAVHCGTGSEKELLQEQITHLGASSCLSLLGELPHSQVLGLMSRSKLLLHTSEFEGFGLVCLEALHAGAQVISLHYPLDKPVPNWHVVNNEEEMASKALELLRSPNSYECPVTLFDAGDIARQLMELFSLNIINEYLL